MATVSNHEFFARRVVHIRDASNSVLVYAEEHNLVDAVLPKDQGILWDADWPGGNLPPEGEFPVMGQCAVAVLENGTRQATIVSARLHVYFAIPPHPTNTTKSGFRLPQPWTVDQARKVMQTHGTHVNYGLPRLDLISSAMRAKIDFNLSLLQKTNGFRNAIFPAFMMPEFVCPQQQQYTSTVDTQKLLNLCGDRATGPLLGKLATVSLRTTTDGAIFPFKSIDKALAGLPNYRVDNRGSLPGALTQFASDTPHRNVAGWLVGDSSWTQTHLPRTYDLIRQLLQLVIVNLHPQLATGEAAIPPVPSDTSVICLLHEDMNRVDIYCYSPSSRAQAGVHFEPGYGSNDSGGQGRKIRNNQSADPLDWS